MTSRHSDDGASPLVDGLRVLSSLVAHLFDGSRWLRDRGADRPAPRSRDWGQHSMFVRAANGRKERRGGETDLTGGGKMRLGRRTLALLVLACAVGSLGLLVTPVLVHGRDSAALSFVKKTLAAHPIVIFSKSYCPYCKRAKTVFKNLGETPFVVELDQRDDGPKIQDALFELVKRRTVPQVFIDGEHIGGSDDTVEAYRSGHLGSLLGSKQSGAWQHDKS